MPPGVSFPPSSRRKIYDKGCCQVVSASKDPHLFEELQPQTALNLSRQPSVPYRAIWMASDPLTRPKLVQLFSGTQFLFFSPKPREKSEELKARLKKLEELAKEKAYQELVKDIVPKKDVNEPFSSYKDELLN